MKIPNTPAQTSFRIVEQADWVTRRIYSLGLPT